MTRKNGQSKAVDANSKTVSEINLNRRIGITIRGLRRSKGMSQSELAKAIHVTQGAISLLERGHRNTCFNLNALQMASQILGMGKLSNLIAFAEDDSKVSEVIRDAEELINKFSDLIN